MHFYGTIGPACASAGTLRRLVDAGMTGLRMNLSHGALAEHADWLAMIHAVGIPDLLIDLQGPELRVGRLASPVTLPEGGTVQLGAGGIPCPVQLVQAARPGQQLLLDDGKLLVEVTAAGPDALVCTVLRGGVLQSRKSIAAPDLSVPMPTLTSEDLANLRIAASCGVTGVMLPFVRGKQDILALRQALAGIALQNLSVPSSELFTEVTGLVPDGLTVDGIDYRDAAGDLLPTIPDAKALYMQARQVMASSDFNGVTILLPQGSGLTETVEQINGAWQKDCSLFFSVEEVPQEEFDARLASGKYTIALAPIRAEGGSVYQMLQQFAGDNSLTGLTDPLYAGALSESIQRTGSARCQLLRECERQLLEGCTVVPLAAQQKRLLVADGVEGLVFDPFTPVLDLTYTTKN